MSDVSRQDNFKARRHLPRSGVSTLERDFGYLKENIPCQDACPANTNIPIYIKQAHDGDYAGCYETNRKVNILPGVLGRICSRPCEDKCRHGEHDLGDPVAICHIKRSGADLRDSQNVKRAPAAASTGKHIAVVGAGPSGLAAAHDLAMNGHKVTLYEARELTGGMLYYGIPRFRLPTEVISGEVDDILALGIECRANTALGSDVTASALLDEHNAVLVAAGCYSPRSLGIGGEDLDGVVSGLEFMMGVNSGSPREGMRSVVVIGGGFTAMDCARTARRLGAEVKVAVLTTEDEMFATRDEITEAKREGIEILTMAMSREFIAGDDGKLGRARFVRTKLGELTPDGLMHEALPIEGSEFELDVDTVIVAIGQGPDPSILDVEVTRDEKGRMVVDRDEFTCGVEGLYLTGDFAWGASTVIESIANGRRAAAHITQMLTGVRPLKWAVTFEAAKPSYRERSFDFIARTEMPMLDVDKRLGELGVEVETGHTAESSKEEAKRCYQCQLRFTIDMSRCIYCRYCIDVAPRDCIKLASEIIHGEDGHVEKVVETSDWSEVMAVVIDNERCVRCGECYRVCPTRCIAVTSTQLVELPADQVQG